MSERNLGLFLPGHVPAGALLEILGAAPGLTPEALFAEGPARVGHGERGGLAYTHLGLPVFENTGFALLGHTEIPGDDDLEMFLGRALSAAYDQALLLQYDDEIGWGGFARFEDGALVDREAVDGRAIDVIWRGLNDQAVLEGLDPSEWIWPRLGAAVERGAAPVLGAGVRSDDDIARVIGAAAAIALTPQAGGPALSQVRAQDSGESGRLRRLLHRLRPKG